MAFLSPIIGYYAGGMVTLSTRGCYVSNDSKIGVDETEDDAVEPSRGWGHLQETRDYRGYYF